MICIGFDPQSRSPYILSLFGRKTSVARRSYSEFEEKGVSDGERPELVGGGLIRSLDGWVAAKAGVGGKTDSTRQEK